MPVFPHNLIVNSEFVAPAFLRLRSGQARRLAGSNPALPLVVLVFAAVLSVSAGAKTKPSPSFASHIDAARHDRVRSDRGYIAALAAANRFLQAWQNQDHETGLLMLTDTAKHHTSEDRLQEFFSPGPATQQAFEISRGKKLKPGRYTFPVALFEIREDQKWIRPRFSQIIVIRTGKDDWAIDKLS